MLGVGNKPYSSAELTMMGDGSSFQTVNQNFQGMVDSLKELEKTCTKTADIRNSLENVTQTVYFDYAHLTDFGNEIIAQKIFDLALPLVNESLEGNILPNGNQLLQKISESNKR